MAGWFGPDNYEDFILDGMKVVTNDLAAQNVQTACRKNFPLSPPPPPPPTYDIIPANLLSKIEGGCKVKYGEIDGPGCEIYNGLTDWIIYEVKIRIHNKGENVSKDYTLKNYGIEPFTKDIFYNSFSPKPGRDFDNDNWSWQLLEARGRKIKN